MGRVEFDKIIDDVKASFLMENLKISDKVIFGMKKIYKENKFLGEKNNAKKRRRIVRYEFRRK